MKNKKALIIGIAATVVLIAVVVLILVFSGKDKLSATTMRLLKIEGTVTLESKGKTKTIIDNLKLNSGDVLSTAVKSLASISLDDYKAVTLQESSVAEFNQSGKNLDLNLKAGSLFFDVSKKLEADETFEIRTATMIAGIRGTSGYVFVDKEGHDGILITDGKVEVVGINPETGIQKTTTVEEGEIIYVYCNDTDNVDDSVTFEKLNVTEDDLPDEVISYLIEHEELLDKVCDATGWSKDKIKKIAEGLPSPTPTTKPSPTEEPTPTEEPPAAAPTATPTATNTPTPTKAPARPAASPTPTVTPTPTLRPSPVPTPTPVPEEPTPEDPENTPTPTPTKKPTNTPTPTAKSTPTPTDTPTPTPTEVPDVKVENIVIDSSLTMAAGESKTIGLSVSPSNAKDKTVNWSSSNTSVATVDSSGKVTGVAAGSATITATAADGGGASATCSVTVTAAAVSLIINHDSLTIPAGSFTETGAEVDPSDTVLTWSSSDTSVATIEDSGGGNVLINGVSAGTAIVTVKGGGLSASCTVTVVDTGSVSISLSKTNVSLGYETFETAEIEYSLSTPGDFEVSVDIPTDNTFQIPSMAYDNTTGSGRFTIAMYNPFLADYIGREFVLTVRVEAGGMLVTSQSITVRVVHVVSGG